MEKYSLVGIDGNAFCVMGYVISCMRKEKKSMEQIEKYKKEAKSSDYNNLLCVSMDIIEKLNNESEEEEQDEY